MTRAKLMRTKADISMRPLCVFRNAQRYLRDAARSAAEVAAASTKLNSGCVPNVRVYELPRRDSAVNSQQAAPRHGCERAPLFDLDANGDLEIAIAEQVSG